MDSQQEEADTGLRVGDGEDDTVREQHADERSTRRRRGVSRRQFLRLGIGTGASMIIPGGLISSAGRVQIATDGAGAGVGAVNRYLCNVGGRTVNMGVARLPATQVPAGPLAMFQTVLRGVGPGVIPVATPDGTVKWGKTKATHYTMDISQYSDTLHPDLGPTTLWGYHSRTNLGDGPGVDNNQRHLSGIIVAQRGSPIQLTFQNNLPPTHILPVDTTLMGADGPQNRAVVHLHGGLTPWLSDGGPYTWFTPAGTPGDKYGPSIMTATGENLYKRLNPNLQDGQAEYYFPNDQSARLVWYHDHAMGITRLNAYAGIASAMIIRDKFEAALRKLGLPDFVENGGRELPLVVQDKFFQNTGALGYPEAYPDDADLYPDADLDLNTVQYSIVPEMFGDTMLMNGTVYPQVAVDGARYRLRLLNACQSRFLNLQLYVANDDGVTPDLTQPGPDFLVLGTEGGFLARPMKVASGQPFQWVTLADGSQQFGGSLITAPAERWDLIVDFSGYAGKSLIFYNDAPAPFPNGDPAHDYNEPGTSPNSRVIMRFDVGAAVAESRLRITPLTPLASNPLSGIDRPLAGIWTRLPLPGPRGAKVRRLTLNEANDAYGRLVQMLGTNEPHPLPWSVDPAFGTSYSREYMDEPTETPKVGATEIWEIANLTGDTHPIHFHLVNAQILWRRPFNVATYNGKASYTGRARGPENVELGWKDTIQMHPGEVTAVIMKFDLPKVPFTVPMSPRTGGHEYVWHCHILEHEEHDMMRPLIVMP
ncbi:multicopper oxidase domain-containing protein [Oscillochloris sp. ZM17-4]|uniref:multicopper oxidase family protein n=1 Tax=Oscillochloris sp. ZM17-4 TaxID=2866714 RepID=UPI001C7324BC|nr:multicopper oxidase domain-containing protein [Oscillochloris sp. ZM17-4]MBX0327822.1 multicopper oxidase domain-containing protein [Oscillochloris sp. ZM17-4]